jgi:VanZ family protein
MRKLRYFIPALGYYLLIFLLSSRNLGIGVDIRGADKVAHLLEFGLLGFLLSIGFFKALSSSPTVKIAVTAVSGLTFGVLDEFHQYFVQGRSSDARDALADAVGVACGIMIYVYLTKKRKK